MRTLKFIVNGQTLTPDPNCDFTGLVPGSGGYLRVEFAFSSEWENTVKVVGFYSRLGAEYRPQHLNDGKSCVIPTEVLAKRVFKIQVMGRNATIRLITNKLEIDQKGGQ